MYTVQLLHRSRYVSIEKKKAQRLCSKEVSEKSIKICRKKNSRAIWGWTLCPEGLFDRKCHYLWDYEALGCYWNITMFIFLVEIIAAKHFKYSVVVVIIITIINWKLSDLISIIVCIFKYTTTINICVFGFCIHIIFIKKKLERNSC